MLYLRIPCIQRSMGGSCGTITATSPLESINTRAFYDVCTVSHGADTLQASQLHTLPPVEGIPRIKNQYSCPPNVVVEGHQKSSKDAASCGTVTQLNNQKKTNTAGCPIYKKAIVGGGRKSYFEKDTARRGCIVAVQG